MACLMKQHTVNKRGKKKLASTSAPVFTLTNNKHSAVFEAAHPYQATTRLADQQRSTHSTK
jgi:hypothetical protein